MILYKYYSYDAGVMAIETGKLGFRRPENFNDPLEFSALSNVSGVVSALRRHKSIVDLIIKNSVVLCLTRTPVNPLMWAHYASESSGIVVGYDFSQSEMQKSFCSFEHNLVPAIDGDVVYISKKPTIFLDGGHITLMSTIKNEFNRLINEPSEIKNISSRSIESYSLMKKIMLTKNSAWSYEEEVRIVKLLPYTFGKKTDNKPLQDHFEIAKTAKGELIDGLYLYKNIAGATPFNATIESVYLGSRRDIGTNYKKNTSPNNTNQLARLMETLKERGIKIFEVKTSKDRWDLVEEELTY